MKTTSFFDDANNKNSKIWNSPTPNTLTFQDIQKSLELKCSFFKKTKNGNCKIKHLAADSSGNLYMFSRENGKV